MDREAIQHRFGIIGSSAAIRNVIDRARQVARADISVLIQGESGVGKELFAHAIHELSPRRHGPLITVNCGAIPEGLIESELFGAEKGAYTGAVERRTGYFEEADGGTIFLDEIGEMPLAAQVRLLRVLETGEFSRVGGAATRRADVRVIAATNKDLAREVQAGRFREDLYYRLSTVVIGIPPLRQRREDIMPIFEDFLYRFSQKYNTPMKRLDARARQLLTEYGWPGNVRELRNVAEQVVVLLRGDAVTADDVRPYLRGVSAAPGGLLPATRTLQGEDGEARERELIYRVLLEMRMELRELREQIGQLVAGGGARPGTPREAPERESFPQQPGEYVILREPEREAFDPLIEDVVFEIEHDDADTAADASADAHNGRVASGADDQPLPTLEDAERALIMRALQRYEGNRRQTARALGISERTLYRKLKELDADV